jgi:hypothetical protein
MMRLRILSGLLVICFLWGCGQNKKNVVKIEVPDLWLQVSTDATALDEAQKLAAKQEQQAYDDLIKLASEPGAYLDSESVDLLESRRADVVDRLKKIASEAKSVDDTAGAGLMLCRLLVPEGRDIVTKVLREGATATREKVLHVIDVSVISGNFGDDSKYTLFMNGTYELVSGLLAQLKDPDPEVVKAAIQTCGMLKLAGVHRRFLKLLDDPKTPDKGRILFWLSKHEMSAELLEKVQKLEPNMPENDHWRETLFEEFAKMKDPKFRLAGRDELKRWLAKSDGSNEQGYLGERLSVLRTLAETSEKEDIPWLEQTIARERGMYATSLAAALVKLDVAGGKRRLIQMFDDPKMFDTAIEVAGDVFADKQDEDVIRALSNATKKGKPTDLPLICEALLQVGGETAKARVSDLLLSLDLREQAQLKRKLNPLPVATIERRVIESGVLDAKSFERQQQLARKHADEMRPRSDSLLSVLESGGICVEFDAETGVLPCRHDRLVSRFARHSRGLFNPTAISEEWNQTNAEDESADYTLRFVYDGRLYQGRLRNLGDWYDVERLVSMINGALGDSKHKEQFIAVAEAGQIAVFVFADRAKFEPLANEFHIPLSTNLNGAMDAGKAFEQEVIESTRKPRPRK